MNNTETSIDDGQHSVSGRLQDVTAFAAPPMESLVGLVYVASWYQYYHCAVPRVRDIKRERQEEQQHWQQNRNVAYVIANWSAILGTGQTEQTFSYLAHLAWPCTYRKIRKTADFDTCPNFRGVDVLPSFWRRYGAPFGRPRRSSHPRQSTIVGNPDADIIYMGGDVRQRAWFDNLPRPYTVSGETVRDALHSVLKGLQAAFVEDLNSFHDRMAQAIQDIDTQMDTESESKDEHDDSSEEESDADTDTDTDTDESNSSGKESGSDTEDDAGIIKEDDRFDEQDVATLVDVMGTSRGRAIKTLRDNFSYLSEPLYMLRAKSDKT